MNNLPLRREADLIVRDLAGETLVYDRERHKAHCLNHAAALVWRHCDGHTSVAQLAALVLQECNGPADEGVVWLALHQLQKARLLQGPMQSPADAPGFSRRDLVRKLGVAAAVPIVMSILAPTAMAAASDTCTGTHPSCVGKRCPLGRNCVSLGGLDCACI
jgi:hypothetical protein